MKENGCEKDRTGRRTRCFGESLIFILLLICMSWMFSAGHVMAASQKKISFTDDSGRYLVYKSKNWYLKDVDGKALTGVQYLAVKKSSSFSAGYYMFDGKGKLLKKRRYTIWIRQ